MATADLLLEHIFSWIEQRERCAEQLKKLAQELESLREKCNFSECYGNTVSVVGAASLIGAGVATVLTAGAAAPFLGVLGASASFLGVAGEVAAVLSGVGAACSGVGVTISVVTQITEHFLSSDTMRKAQKIEKNNNEIAKEIQQLFQQLQTEKKEVSSFADPDELDRHIITEILRAMARRSGLKWQIKVRIVDNMPQFFFYAGPRYMRLNQIFFEPEVIVGLAGILTFFTFQVRGKIFKLLFAKGAEQLIKEASATGFKTALKGAEQLIKETSATVFKTAQKGGEQLIKKMSTTGFKTALKGGAMVVGGSVGMAFALPEAIDNWKDLIKKNHVTEASQSLRDTAEEILKISRTLRKQLDVIKKMFDEMAKSQREHEEKSSKPAQEKSGNQETSESQIDQKHEDDRKGDQTEQTRSEQNEQRGSEQQGGGDQGDKESDSEDEESDQGDKESDSEDEESDQEDEESDSEEETEDDESKQTGRKKTKRHRKKGTQSKQRGESKEVVNQCQDSCIGQDQKIDSSIDKESNHEFKTNQRPPVAIRVGLLNVRSMNNKISRMSELITRNNLDVFLTTETWLREDTGDTVLREASPETFTFNHQVRDGRGGGVAIQFSQVLQGEQIIFDFITFEYVATVLQHDEWDQPVLIINVYHPPGYNLTQFRAFLNEFQMLLNEVFENYNSIIVTGDFNIWVDNERRSSTDEFEFFLLINDLDQHVEEPTHQAGHFLDLVITRNVEIYGLSVRDDGISDHYTVYFNARPVSKDTSEKTEENMDQDEQAKRFKKKEE